MYDGNDKAASFSSSIVSCQCDEAQRAANIELRTDRADD